MRIVVNDIAASAGGALSVLRDFYTYVKNNDTENEWIFLLSDRYFEETEKIKIIALPEIKKSRVKKLCFDLFSGKKFIHSLKPDRVLSLQNIITFGVKVPQAVYIHQALPFSDKKKFSFFKKSERSLAVYQRLIGRIIKLSAKMADTVFVQTEWFNNEIARLTDKNKILIAPPVVSDLNGIEFKNDACSNSFFYPTNRAIYKNNDCIYSACEILRSKGITDFKVSLTIDTDKTDENIEQIGFIDRENLLCRYSTSTLLFPSYIETFGYPLAEAGEIGTIVLASDCPFSREVLEDYENAYFFDPFKPNELAELMERVIKKEIVAKKTAKALIKPNGWEIIISALLKEDF